ncbi:MAG: DUF192 domain-containing protein [Candidatus Riflebacteria bacterium]|nr:DUF192 domain-containing protein [Candidatus Riflebacteria bacterium]
MKSKSLLLCTALAGTVLLPSCFLLPGTDNSETKVAAATLSPVESGEPQKLPVYEASIGTHTLHLMIARSGNELRTGLMFRTEMNPDEGMLFVYSDTQPTMTFWMKNTRIPLDVVFFSSDLSLTEIIRGMRPGTGIPDDQLPRYQTHGPAQYALELSSGTADLLNLKPGDQLNIPLTLLFSDGSR